MSITYRTLTISDHLNVSDLWSTSDGVVIRTSDSEESVAKYLSRNQNLSFVAENDGETIGSILAGHDGKRGYIQHLIVSPDHRCAGIGSHLVSLCIGALSELGIVKSHIHVLVSNKEARAFWAKQGWNLRDDIVVYSYLNTTDKNA